MGSPSPLLLTDETRFSRIGVTAEIFGTGFRPLNSTAANAGLPASSRYSKIRFRSLRSISSYSARSLTPQGARAHSSGAAFLLLVHGLLDPCQEGAKVLHSNKSSAAFSRFLAAVPSPAPCSPFPHFPYPPS